MMCLTTGIDTLVPNPLVPNPSQYDVLTTIKWLAKSLCKIPLYMELVYKYHKNTNILRYLAFSFFLLLVSCPGYLLLYFFVNKPNTLIVIIVIVIAALLGIIGGMVTKNSTKYLIGMCVVLQSPTITCNFLIFLSVVFVFTEIISSYTLFRITQSIDFLKNKSILFVCVSVLLSMIGGIVIENSTKHPIPDTCCTMTAALKVAWKVVNIISVVMYLMDISYHTSDLSFILITLSILVTVSIFLIAFNYKSAYAVALIIILFVIHNMMVLHDTWSSNSKVFHVTQVTCQLTVVGALLYTTGYNYGRKTAD